MQSTARFWCKNEERTNLQTVQRTKRNTEPLGHELESHIFGPFLYTFKAKALKGQMIGRILLDKMKWFLMVGND